jgi:hypothetical protein
MRQQQKKKMGIENLARKRLSSSSAKTEIPKNGHRSKNDRNNAEQRKSYPDVALESEPGIVSRQAPAGLSLARHQTLYNNYADQHGNKRSDDDSDNANMATSSLRQKIPPFQRV